MANKLYEIITEMIIKELENGVIRWEKTWGNKNVAVSRLTGERYSLLNQISIGRGGEYATRKQILDGGGSLKGAKAYMCCFFAMMPRKKKDEESEEEEDDEEKDERRVPVLRYYNIFNVEDCGLKPKWTPARIDDPNMEAECIISNYLYNNEGLSFETKKGYETPRYSIKDDSIIVPDYEDFRSMPDFYSTAFHEIVHSTGATGRLNRKEVTEHDNIEAYSKEELCAELGAAMLMGECGMESYTIKNNAAYIESWLKALKNDRRMLVFAACKAEKAVKYILKGYERENN